MHICDGNRYDMMQQESQKPTGFLCTKAPGVVATAQTGNTFTHISKAGVIIRKHFSPKSNDGKKSKSSVHSEFGTLKDAHSACLSLKEVQKFYICNDTSDRHDPCTFTPFLKSTQIHN